MASEPRIRAAMTQSLLTATRKLSTREANEVLAALEPAEVERIEQAIAVAFLPMSLHVKLSETLYDTAGSARFIAISRAVVASALKRPLFTGFVDMTARLFGTGPMQLLGQGPRLYDLSTRDLGRIEFEPRTPSECIIRLEDFPSRQFRFEVFVLGVQGATHSLVDLFRMEAEVEVIARDAPAGRAELRVALAD
jgi:hypothetical protein